MSEYIFLLTDCKNHPLEEFAKPDNRAELLSQTAKKKAKQESIEAR